jgi:signal transduction histidine kinase/CheY-like chemotaxis protein
VTDKISELEQLLHEQKIESMAYHKELQERTAILEQQGEEIRKKNIELKLAQHEIREKANYLETASKYKSEFFANISHEFRTPLNSIIVLSQLIAENRTQNLTEKQKEFAKTIYSSGNVLLELINEILEVTKIESGKIELRPVDISLWELTDQLKMMFQPLAQQKGLEFVIELEDNLPEKIFSDSKRLHQILRNLLSNAVKFTEKGSIRIRLWRPSADHSMIAISVIDTGIGISEDKLSAVFEAFQQGDGTTSSKYGGTGLGLTIARSLAAMLGGRVKLESTPGKGSVFTLEIPDTFRGISSPQKGFIYSPWKNGDIRKNYQENNDLKVLDDCVAQDDRDSIRHGDKTVLIVDDDISFANLIYDFAKESGYKCIIAQNGICGIDLARRYMPGALLLDICLPDKNGWEVFEVLKNDPYTQQIPVFFISGAEEGNEVKEMGAKGFYTKPVSLDMLRELFSRMEDLTGVPVIRAAKDETGPVPEFIENTEKIEDLIVKQPKKKHKYFN